MGLVRVLPPAVADQIAAGEVVDRPAAVVRELVDNALDAGACRLEVDVEGGGVQMIGVADDGAGMDRDDAVLAFERHATSKLRAAEDLTAVQTLGFRGEALAAIAAVARVELITRPAEASSGTRVVIERGRLVRVEDAPRSPGTTVQVRDLFGGIPARRKFLKSDSTESEQAVKAVVRAALARPDVSFRVRVDGRVVVSVAAGAEPRERVADLLGSRQAAQLLTIEAASATRAARGWIGKADLHRGDRDGLQIFVNRRPVRDPILMRAILDAYRGAIPMGRHPIAVLFLDLPPEEVDVNVHPAKSEVRFQRPQEVRALVYGALTQALGTRAAVPDYPLPGATLGPGAGTAAAQSAPWATAERGGLPHWELREATTAPDARWVEGAGADQPGFERPPLRLGGGPQALAQALDCFIVAQDEHGLLVVDQHVAHERYLFERLRDQARQAPLARQALLFPESLVLDAGTRQHLQERRDALERLGFRFESFGTDAVLLREAPAVLGRDASAAGLEALLHRMAEGENPDPLALFDHLLATMACHTAVRKGMKLGLEQMNHILLGLACCEAPTHCPHGRVISLRLDLPALERAFGRIR